MDKDQQELEMERAAAKHYAETAASTDLSPAMLEAYQLLKFQQRLRRARKIVKADTDGEKWMRFALAHWENWGWKFAPDPLIEGKAEAQVRFFLNPLEKILTAAFIHGAQRVGKSATKKRSTFPQEIAGEFLRDGDIHNAATVSAVLQQISKFPKGE